MLKCQCAYVPIGYFQIFALLRYAYIISFRFAQSILFFFIVILRFAQDYSFFSLLFAWSKSNKKSRLLIKLPSQILSWLINLASKRRVLSTFENEMLALEHAAKLSISSFSCSFKTALLMSIFYFQMPTIRDRTLNIDVLIVVVSNLGPGRNASGPALWKSEENFNCLRGKFIWPEFWNFPLWINDGWSISSSWRAPFLLTFFDPPRRRKKVRD